MATRRIVTEGPTGFFTTGVKSLPAQSDQYHRERTALVDAVCRFVTTWHLPHASSALVEVRARLEYRVGQLRLYGRLDLLTPPEMPGAAARVNDWKLSAFRDDEEGEVPLAVVGQAALARAHLGRRIPVTVRWGYVKALTEQVWHFGQRELVDGFARIRVLACHIVVDRWPPRPGEQCVRCQVSDCEHFVGMPDAADLGLVDPQEPAD